MRFGCFDEVFKFVPIDVEGSQSVGSRHPTSPQFLRISPAFGGPHARAAVVVTGT
jgi:hypothetical protein